VLHFIPQKEKRSKKETLSVFSKPKNFKTCKSKDSQVFYFKTLFNLQIKLPEDIDFTQNDFSK
ncbi:hypothetical protein B0A67_15980, partial [Flavobacterium aquidurense]